MLKKMLLVAVMFLGATVTQAAPNNTVVELALTEVGTGSAEEMRKRIFNLPVTVLLADFRREAIERLPDSIRQQRITSGRLLSRAEEVIQPVLRLHERTESVNCSFTKMIVPAPPSGWAAC